MKFYYDFFSLKISTHITNDRCATGVDRHQRRNYSLDDCLLPVAEGQCSGAEVRWYFDAVRQDCSAFYYTGCAANGNNFRDYEDCYAFCSSGIPSDTVTVMHLLIADRVVANSHHPTPMELRQVV